MIILLSPAKTFNNTNNRGKSEPFFIKESNYLLKYLKSFNENEIKSIFKTSDKLTLTVRDYYLNFNYDKPAIYTYGGQVFKALDPLSIEKSHLNNIYIFSALYGLLNAFDNISKYRLDFTNKIMSQSLYSFWDTKLNDYLKENLIDKPIINLSSKEFTDTLDYNLENLYHIDFIEMKNNKVTRPSMLIKTMRGLFAREILINNFKTINDLKNINIDGFIYNDELSNNNLLTFIKED